MLIKRNTVLTTLAVGVAGLGVGAAVATAADSGPKPAPKTAMPSPPRAEGMHLDKEQMASMMRRHHADSRAMREDMRTMRDEMMRTP